jgi:hypothetical protein
LVIGARRGCVGFFDLLYSYEAEGTDAMTITKPVEISATKASGGIKLNAMRYVLGISIALAAVAGMILWNMYATH